MTLPTPESHDLPPEATIALPVPSDGLRLYRVLEGPEARQKDFEPTYTRPQAQLRRIPELFRGSVSFWLEPEQALAALRGRRLWCAELVLQPEPLTRVALTELDPRGEARTGHVDVWGYPGEILACVIDVTALDVT